MLMLASPLRKMLKKAVQCWWGFSNIRIKVSATWKKRSNAIEQRKAKRDPDKFLWLSKSASGIASNDVPKEGASNQGSLPQALQCRIDRRVHEIMHMTPWRWTGVQKYVPGSPPAITCFANFPSVATVDCKALRCCLWGFVDAFHSAWHGAQVTGQTWFKTFCCVGLIARLVRMHGQAADCLTLCDLWCRRVVARNPRSCYFKALLGVDPGLLSFW